MNFYFGARHSIPTTAQGLFINTAVANCSIYESGRMVYSCIKESKAYKLDYLSLDMFDVPLFSEQNVIELLENEAPSNVSGPVAYDFFVLNWHHATMQPYLSAAAIRRLPGLRFTIVLEMEPEDPLKLVPPSTFHGFIALDSTAQRTDAIYPFPRPLEGTPRNGKGVRRKIPVIGSFGFGTPGKGFELLIDAVNREFDNAVVNINVPDGTYAEFNNIHQQYYPDYVEAMCRRIAKPGIEVRFTHDFMSPDELVKWCGNNDLNCFMYTRRQPGLSATTDQAIISGRPLLTLSNDTFRHILGYIPAYPIWSLRTAMRSSPALVRRMQRAWSRREFHKTFHQMLAAFGLITQHKSRTANGSKLRSVKGLIVIASQRISVGGDVLDYEVRLADSLRRSGQNQVVLMAYNDVTSFARQAGDLGPDCIILCDDPPTSERAMLIASLRSVVVQIILLSNEAAPLPSPEARLIQRLKYRPIVPFYTVNVGLRQGPPRIWLIGFSASGSNLEDVISKIVCDVPAVEIVVEAPEGAIASCKDRLAELTRRLDVDGTALIVPVTLPTEGRAIIEILAECQLSIFYNDAARSTLLTNISSLALATERAVVFTRAASFSCYGDRASFIEDVPIVDLFARGVATKIALVNEFGEWRMAAEIGRTLAVVNRRRNWRKGLALSSAGRASGVATQFDLVDLPQLIKRDGDEFIQLAFQVILGREPDAPGNAHYLARLNQGMSKSAVVGALSLSAEARRHRCRLKGRWKAVLALMAYRVVGMRKPVSTVRIADLLSQPDEDFVNASYLSLLGRMPDLPGYAYMLGKLRSGRSRRLLLAELALSPEGRAHGAWFAGLPRAILQARLMKTRLVGPILRLAACDKEPFDIERALRSIEGQIRSLTSGDPLSSDTGQGGSRAGSKVDR